MAVCGGKTRLTPGFADGSFGAAHYLANDHKPLSQAAVGSGLCQPYPVPLDNFRELTGYGRTGFEKMKLMRRAKSKSACAVEFVEAIPHGGSVFIAFEVLVEASQVSFEVIEASE